MLKAMNSTNPNEMMLDKAEQKPKTWVCWDINSCPVPDGYDARMVGQCIASALEKAGYSGPLTITAIGNLDYTLIPPHDVLRAIFSTGISLNNVMDGFGIILEELRHWRVENPPPATLMLISGARAYSDSIYHEFSKLQRLGYTTLLSYPQQAHFPWDHLRDWLWETLIKDAKDSGVTRRQALQEKCCETGESSWLCSTCTNWSLSMRQYYPWGLFQGKSYEDFTTHLKTMDHVVRKINLRSLQKPKTWVFWDINSCPVPDGYDPRMVGQFIASALEKAGYSGPLTTITAIGNLKHTLKQTPDVLPKISSTGIFLNHAPGGYWEIYEEYLRWQMENPPPATLMVITGDVKGLKRLSRELSQVGSTEYTLLQAYPQSAAPSSLVNSENSTTVSLEKYNKCIWERLLKDAIDSGETRRHALEEMLCETGEPPCRFFCALCKFAAADSFEDFTTHLKGRDHLVREVNSMQRPRPCKRRLVKPTFNVSKFVNKQRKDPNSWIEEDRMSL